MLSDNFYMASVITCRPKNRYPLLYTDSQGKIIAANYRVDYYYQAKSLINCNTRVNIEDISIFALFPRLFMHYYPAFSWTMRDIRRRDNRSSRGIESEGIESTTYYDDANMGVENKSRYEYDCFLFLMMAFNSSTEVLSGIDQDVEVDVQPRQKKKRLSVEGGSSNFKLYYNTVKSNLRVQSRMPRIFKLISNIVSRERKLITNRLRDILRVKLDVEVHTYSRGMIGKEVSIINNYRTGNKVQKFFKLFAQNPGSSLIEILMISPENVNNVCRSI